MGLPYYVALMYHASSIGLIISHSTATHLTVFGTFKTLESSQRTLVGVFHPTWPVVVAGGKVVENMITGDYWRGNAAPAVKVWHRCTSCICRDWHVPYV